MTSHAHATTTTIHSAPLRRVLFLDAIATGGMAVLLVAGAGPLAELLGLPVALLRWAGVALVPFVALLAWSARRARVPRGAVWVLVIGNALWAVGSALLLVSGWVSPTVLGIAFVLGQAAVVALFAAGEWAGLRRVEA